MAKYLIINADDLGVTKGVCEAIVAGAEAGLLTDTTAMMCVPDTVAKIKAVWPRLTIPVGVHLQLSGGQPLSAPMRAFCMEKFGGAFPERADGPIYPEALVEEEWNAQIEFFAAHFGPPSHIDTHSSFHRMPRYIDTYLKVASRFDLPVRGDGVGYAARAREAGVTAADLFLGGITLRGLPVAEIAARLEEGFALVEGGVVELVLHPGHVDDDMRQVAGDRAAGRGHDLALVINPAFRDHLKAAGIELVNYRQVEALVRVAG